MGPRHRCRGITRSVDQTRTGQREGFNGATASLPWNRSIGIDSNDGDISFNGATASLPWNRVSTAPSRTARSLLQWGHGIAAVESSELPASAVPVFGASMGPRHRCRGISKAPWAAIRVGDASMGPRHRCRGIRISLAGHDDQRAASMGPRHRCRGIVAESHAAASSASGFNGATASLPWNLPGGTGAHGGLRGFNGATASLPWNHL